MLEPLMMDSSNRFNRGFTLVEMLIAIALIAIVLAIGVPNFGNYVVTQRLKGVTAELVTDLQFARAEAATRNRPVFFSYRSSVGVKTCYVIYVPTAGDVLCNCALASCPGVIKLKTVEQPVDSKVRFASSNGDFAFDNVSGGLLYGTSDFVDATPTAHTINTQVISDTGRKLQTTISPAGRPTVCSAGSKMVAGYPSC
jgi:type IV fimbrial biogenesis protein FimT